MKHYLLAATLAIAMRILIGILGVICFDVSAIAEPGRAESYIASAGRHFLIEEPVVQNICRHLLKFK